MSNPVELHDVVKTYDLGENVRVEALRGVSLTIKKGEFVSVMGPSGSGKTTLLNMIGGLDNPTDGRIIIDGIDVTNMGEGELAKLRREKIGFIFQFFNLVPLLTASENVELPMIFTGKLSEAEIKGRAAELLQLVGLGKRMHHRPPQMSGGEQQRVAIARALANEPSLILADEPTGNIDRETGWKIIRFMKGLNETLEQTFIIVTHDPSIAQTSEKNFYMVDGRISPRPPKQITAPHPDTLTEESRQLLLAELRWLRISLTSLEEKKGKMDRELYDQFKVRYTEQLKRLKQLVQDTNRGRN